MKLYRIKHWDEHFENNRTRCLDELRWVPIPNKHDGDGYSEMVAGQDGAAIYGAWITLVQVASKCRPRGTLVREGDVPHTATSLARVTRLPSKIIQLALDRACEPAIGWMEVVDSESGALERHSDVTRTSLGCAPSTMEWNGMEEKGITLSPTSPSVIPVVVRPVGQREKFIPPSLEEAKTYGTGIGLMVEDCEAWHDHFLANGWKVGKAHTPMKDWQSSMRTWKRNKPQFSTTTNGGRSFSVNELRAIAQAKEQKAAELKHRYCSEGPLSDNWNDQAKRKEYTQLRKEIRDLTTRISNYA